MSDGVQALESRPSSAAAAQPGCSLCGRASQEYLFTRHRFRVQRCRNCRLVTTVAEGTSAQVRQAPAGESSPERPPLDSSTERRAAERYVAELERRGARPDGILAVTTQDHPFLAAARERGLTIANRITVDALAGHDIPGGPYSSAVVISQLEKASDPVCILERIHKALAPDGMLLLVTPSIDSLPARLLRSQWTEWIPENRCLLDTQTVQSACLRAGFDAIELAPDWRHYTLDHVDRRAASLAPTPFTRLVCKAAALAPSGWRRALHVRLPASGIVVTARRAVPPPRPLLSIVMPVYNERATFERTLEAVLAKGCDGVDKEVVIVESRSTDGTRELVQRYEGREGVRIILEDRPRGKGAAVRRGLQEATGTIVLIQDADDEYDVNDYDALLEPILSFRTAFVLGSRHTGSWKVRSFADQPAVSAFFNFGHVIFRTALNVLYGQKLDDPFTMYKVFRRDCLHRLKLECNRFDFDFELVIKLLRKGYEPIEVPVNYRSRSFSEGKKVSAVRDPLTWIRSLVKYRFASIYED